MADSQLIDGLISTYRTLNLTIRSLPGDDNPALRESIRKLRDDELRFSQALKARVTLGQPMPTISEEEKGVIGTEGEHDSLAEFLAQFGTARESTLSLLRGLSPEDWNATGIGPKTIAQIIDEHLANDQKHLAEISAAIGTPLHPVPVTTS
jgi:hypothetical protein